MSYIVGIAGGSGSGKTYLSRALQSALGTNNCEIIFQDYFYIDQSKKFDHDGGSVNFDHPNSIDFPELIQSIKSLQSGKETLIPKYDFVTHSRLQERVLIQPKPIILVDGILIYHSPELRSLFNERIFCDEPEEVRFRRRLARDVKERGRTEEGVTNQFFKQVKPMHDQFVEPTKIYAHKIVNESNYGEMLKKLVSELSQRMRK